MTNRMTSQRQIDANRRNAKLSTGPGSVAGKMRSRANALRHGLTAQRCLMPGESAHEAKKFRDAIVSELSPSTIMEEQIAERIAWLMWRSRRIPEFEAALYDPAITRNLDADPSNDWPRSMDDINRGFEMIQGSDVGKLLLSGATDKLTRYEMSLTRQLRDALNLLATLKEKRKERDAEGHTMDLNANEKPQNVTRNGDQASSPSTADALSFEELRERCKAILSARTG